MGSEEETETAMMRLPHQDCEECQLNVEIISVNGDLISKQILQGMEKSAYSDKIGTDSEANRHAVRANRQSEESERSDAGILFIT
jgi:hypothetical protein